MIKTTFYISGMTCPHCQDTIEKGLRKAKGVQGVAVSYARGTAIISYDEKAISMERISSIVDELGYKVLPDAERSKADIPSIAGLILIVVLLYLLLEYTGLLNMLAPYRLAESTMGYGMLLIIGLLTSVHCIAMCGGINLSQSISHKNDIENDHVTILREANIMPREANMTPCEANTMPREEHTMANAMPRKVYALLRPTFLYNLGRVVSYTVVGFIVGAIGSSITFTNTMQGVLKLMAGIFMVIMGINMTGVFPWLRRFNLRMPRVFSRKLNIAIIGRKKGKNQNALVVGLLNGLMPCGPLQAMQIYALSTGNAFEGALSMFIFSLGTVPLMFGLGAVSSILNNKFRTRVMAVGSVLVVVLGLSMLTQGWRLSRSDSNPEYQSANNGDQTKTKDQGDIQVINSSLRARSYPNITVQAGVPVKWVIDARQENITGCNYRMLIREYGIEHTFEVGENVVEFTPTKAGKYQYTCWMGMIRGTITVE